MVMIVSTLFTLLTFNDRLYTIHLFMPHGSHGHGGHSHSEKQHNRKHGEGTSSAETKKEHKGHQHH